MTVGNNTAVKMKGKKTSLKVIYAFSKERCCVRLKELIYMLFIVLSRYRVRANLSAVLQNTVLEIIFYEKRRIT